MTDLLALGAIAGMTLVGRHRGGVGMTFLAGGLVGGYLAALLLFRPVGSFLASVTDLPGLVTYPLGGMIVLLVVSTVFGHFARRYRRQRNLKIEDGWEPSKGDEIGGMVVGGAYGVAIVMIVSWAAVSLGGLYGGREVQMVRESVTGRLSTEATQRAVAVGARAVVGDPFVARSVARMVADPLTAIEGLNEVMRNPEVHSLLSLGAIQLAAEMQDASLLAGTTGLVSLAEDEEFVSAMRTFGLLERGSGAADPTELAEAIVREAGPALRTVDALRADPEVRRVLVSPAFREAWAQGDVVRLAMGDEFKDLLERVLEELRRNR